MTLTAADRRLFWMVGVALFFSYAYFYQAGGWNQNSRFALVRAVLEHQTLSIDAYRDETGDRAAWRGHYYSDKAPGASLLALVPVDVARAIGFLVGVNPQSDAGVAWTSYAATVATSGLFTVAAALSVMWLSLFWGYSRAAALCAATAYGVASPAWPYATLFMGHGVTAGCLAIAFAAAVAAGPASQSGRRRVEWLVGGFGGLAVLAEFPAAVPLAFIVTLALLVVRDADRREVVPAMIRIAIGGGVSALALFAYDTAAFGSPFHLGYASEEGFEQLRTGLFGISYPQWWRVREILVGAYRGLLPIAPLVALTPIGLVRLARAHHRLRPALVASGIAVFYLLLNASYFYWEGGWAFGPRHVTPALPFLALGLAPLWDEWTTIGRAALAGGWIWGVALNGMAVATTPQPPAFIERPVAELVLPAFRAGELALNTQRFTDARADAGAIARYTGPRAGWNLGMKMGLNGLVSLSPLAALWLGAAGWIIFDAPGRRPASSRAHASTSATGPRGPR